MEEAVVRWASAALTAAVGIAGCTSVDAKTATFATLAEATPAVDRGWVPAGLPNRSYELRAAYVPDSWQRWGIINFPAESSGELRALLQPDEISLAGVRCDVPGRIEWWPVQLRHELDADRIAATGAKAYRGRSGNLIWVVNWSQGRAYYWTQPERSQSRLRQGYGAPRRVKVASRVI
jgi:hypothetical protein